MSERNFSSPLIVQVMDNGKTFKLVEPFSYRFKGNKWATVITAQVGFISDFASIPRLVRIIIPKLGKYTEAAVIHDFSYQYPSSSRKKADVIFLAGMRDSGVVFWKRYLMYWSVRLFGWLAWKRQSK